MNSQIMIKKFGGTSVGSIERVLAAADRIYEDYSAGEKIMVVVSAMSGETNRLIQLAGGIDPSYRGPAYDMLLSSGEQVSVGLLAIALGKKGISAVPLLAHQAGIQTDAVFSGARIENVKTDLIFKIIEEGKIPILAGFQGITNDHQITTLGRGGSDTTALAVAAALGQSVCEIYTDVPSIYTADPRIVPSAVKISELSFEEMMEMAILGAKVLHFRAVEIAAKFNVKIHLLSSFEKTKGTWITLKEDKMESPAVSAVIHDMDTAIIKLFPIPWGIEVIANIFEALAKKSILVDVISQSYNSEGQRLAFSVKEDTVSSALQAISSLVEEKNITVVKDTAKVSVVGVGMANQFGAAAAFFKVLNQCETSLHLVTTSDIKISAVIDKKNVSKAVEKLHQYFCLKEKL